MKLFVIVISVMALSGCFSTGPIDNRNFGNIDRISDLNGIYINRGSDGMIGGTYTYLSKIIWPKDNNLHHVEIDKIIVTASDDDKLLVEAMSGDSILKKQLFIKGIDFDIQSGRIQLRRALGGVNDNFAGATYTSISLGLDTSGNGKYRNEETFVGVGLLIPMVVHGTSDVRFSRIK